ncbi:MAG: radical SAM protein, partial [Desulfurobacteriaceae bacterium]
RNLKTEEIIAQYELLKGKLPIKGIAIAGIGEPALNVESVENAVNYFRSKGLKVTISTTGYPFAGFKKLVELPHNGLTLSVHSVLEETRSKIFKKKEKLEELLGVIEEHIARSSSSRRKKFQLGYLLIKGLNDDRENLRLLGEVAKKHRFAVMLMAYNKVESSDLEPVSKEEYEKAFLFLREMGVRVTLSNRFRTDRLGGCGTLTVGRIKGEKV